jgi:hypothetical protein
MLRASITFLALLVSTVSRVDAEDRTLSSADIAKIKQIAHQSIGLPFQDASPAVQLAQFARNESKILRPWTTCDGQYCSWSIGLRDGAQVLFTFLHLQRNWKTAKAQDVTPDVGRKGNNRYVGVALVRKGKVIFSEGYIDAKTSNHALQRTADRRENF